MTKLRINEIFFSLQGESRTVGIPTVFVRLTGCPLRCQYCDTAYAFHQGDYMTLEEIMTKVQSYSSSHVTVSGGEPLAQREPCLDLMKQLCDVGYQVSIETSGAMDIDGVDPRVVRVVDIKTPGSKESDKNLLSNLDHLTEDDQLKFVICDREDFDWSCGFIEEHGLKDRCELLFSPSYGQVSETDLANWILEARAPVRFQFQLHKMLWGDQPGV